MAKEISNNIGFGGLLRVALVFFRIGLFTLGGGYAMVQLIEREVVERRRWLSAEEVPNVVAVGLSLPGVVAINMSVYIGYRLRGWQGAVACALGTALPSLLIILAIAIWLPNIKDSALVERIFSGLRPAVVALIAEAGSRLVGRWRARAMVVSVAAAAASWLLGVSPVAVLLVAAVGGLCHKIYEMRRTAGHNGKEGKP